MKKPSMITYIIHYTPLKERAQNLRASKSIMALLPEFITEQDLGSSGTLLPPKPWLKYTRPTLLANLYSQVYLIAPILYFHYNALASGSLRIGPCMHDEIPPLNFLNACYKQALSALSCKNYDLTSQHVTALTRFLLSGRDCCLILEDDTLCIHNDPIRMISCLDDAIASLPCSLPIFADISSSLGLMPKYHEPAGIKNFTKMAFGQTKCASAYLVNRHCAQIILSSSLSLILPVDWHYAYILKENLVTTLWIDNPLFNQGSQINIYPSNQLSRNNG